MEHGTVEMYRKELRSQQNHGDLEVCNECKAAQAASIAAFRATRTRDRSAETRNTTIRRRALARLAAEYPERLADLVADERAHAGL